MAVDGGFLALSFAFGILVGVMSALFGIGGGLLIVPFLVIVGGFTQHLSEGTSLVVIIPTALVGVFAHRRAGYGSLSKGALLGLGGIAGSLLGATLALSLRGDVLQQLFGGLTIVLGIRLAIQGIRQRDNLTEEGSEEEGSAHD